MESASGGSKSQVWGVLTDRKLSRRSFFMSKFAKLGFSNSHPRSLYVKAGKTWLLARAACRSGGLAGGMPCSHSPHREAHVADAVGARTAAELRAAPRPPAPAD